jgi:hypothetical protein
LYCSTAAHMDNLDFYTHEYTPDKVKFMQVNRDLHDTLFWLEDQNGKLERIETVVNTLGGLKVIPELLYSLVIEARIFNFGSRATAICT